MIIPIYSSCIDRNNNDVNDIPNIQMYFFSRCTECDCSYTTASILKRHMLIKHINQNGKDSIETSLSEKASEEPADDNVDSRVAVLDKQFQCTECVKSFKYASSL